MSNHSEWSKLHNAQKDLQRDIEKNQNSLKWILIIAVASFLLALINFILNLAK